MALYRIHEEGTGNHQGFLVGQQYPLALLYRRKSGPDPCCTNNGSNNSIRLLMGGKRHQGFFAGQHLCIRPGCL